MEKSAAHFVTTAEIYGWFPKSILGYDRLHPWLLRWFWHRAAFGETPAG